MKTFDERNQMVASKLNKMKKRRTIVRATGLTLALAVVALVLFLPLDAFAPNVSAYSASEYYPVIKQINKMTWNTDRYKNNFDILVQSFSNSVSDRLTGGLKGEAMPAPGAPMAGAPMDSPVTDSMNGTGNYVEVTDNQVAGVTEADLIKRSDKYIYYLSGNNFLGIYSINKEDSDYVGGINFMEAIQAEFGRSQVYYGTSDVEMYLSTDCTTVTVVMNTYEKQQGSSILLVNLDVTDPGNIRLINHVFFSGDLLSTRVVDGDLLLVYRYRVSGDVDFDEPETYVPTYGKPGQMVCIPGEDIICPDNADVTRYTVICKLNGKDLQVLDTAALLSYSEDLYVSADTIYATHNYSESQTTLEGQMTVTKTDITGISYIGHKLEKLGSITVDGAVKDQYSMDQHNGLLRVVTSTTKFLTNYDQWGKIGTASRNAVRNVDLYCIDLTDWTVRSSVIAFAPAGEEATAVRFNGDTAYVCTAEVIVMTDPVYFFDLSDPDNISWTDTGTIDGYSTSLIDLGDGYLAGIGFSEMRTLKVEIYEETEEGVVSVTSFELEADFSQVYKSYLIDREQDLIGLAVYDFSAYNSNGDALFRYILLHFDGYKLVEVASIPLESSDMGAVRGVLIDGYLYLLQPNLVEITVQKLW
ncbi:MAG: hypothetical protein E7436_01675 [Ruminococcaceae bacterium]|nr:hypothetical protein [Oscillospiraceae bacterium]